MASVLVVSVLGARGLRAALVGVRVAVAVAGALVGVRVAVAAAGVDVRVAVAVTGVEVRVAVAVRGVDVRVAVAEATVGVTVAVAGTGVEVRVAVAVDVLVGGGPGVCVRTGAGGAANVSAVLGLAPKAKIAMSVMKNNKRMNFIRLVNKGSSLICLVSAEDLEDVNRLRS